MTVREAVETMMERSNSLASRAERGGPFPDLDGIALSLDGLDVPDDEIGEFAFAVYGDDPELDPDVVVAFLAGIMYERDRT